MWENIQESFTSEKAFIQVNATWLRNAKLRFVFEIFHKSETTYAHTHLNAFNAIFQPKPIVPEGST